MTFFTTALLFVLALNTLPIIKAKTILLRITVTRKPAYTVVLRSEISWTTTRGLKNKMKTGCIEESQRT